jgi:Polyketide cyclase / dehydrase and lipid transport
MPRAACSVASGTFPMKNLSRLCCGGRFHPSGALSHPAIRLLALIPVAVALPFFLPRRPRVVRRILIRAKPAEIFPFLNDLRNWPLWTTWARRDNIHFSYDGAPSGIGAVQRWEARSLEGVLKITQSVPDERVVYDLTMGHGRYFMEGVLSLESFGELTRVTWLCKWHSGPNPYMRYIDLAFKWRIGRDFGAGLENLRQLVEDRSR